MVYMTGDCHGDYGRFYQKNFQEQKEMSKQDYVIITGDFGLWEKSDKQIHIMEELSNRSFTTLWVDGNHENYDMLKEYPVSEWNGGRVHFITPSIIHLMRGQIYIIEGQKFFTFGGARSHDIQGGILEPDDPHLKEKKRILNSRRTCYRINHISWWKEEMASEDEKAEGIRNMEKNDWKVDYIITHCCPTSVQAFFMNGACEADDMTNYLQTIEENAEFKNWFFGHYHDDRRIDEKHIMLWEQIVRII